jgi:hypothetical protein
VWRRLRKQIGVERALLRQLLDDHRSLLAKCVAEQPNRVEISALAAVLHGFYTGVENTFKRVAIEADDDLPSGNRWHKALLERMSQPGPGRLAVISVALAEILSEYLAFRHFFRSAYPFALQWERMGRLVRECEQTFQRLERELDAFLDAAEGNA